MNSSTAQQRRDLDAISEVNSKLPSSSKIQFLSSLQPEAGTIYGHKNKDRSEEPSMK